MNNTRIAAPVLVRSGQDRPVRLFFDKDCNCHVNAGGQFKLEDIDGGTIKDLNQRFISALAIAARFSRINITLNKDISDEVMSLLRVSGIACYNSLGDSFHLALEKYKLDSSNANIIILSPASFPLLWEFIYTGNPLAKLDADLFWGARHRLTRILTGIQKERSCVEDARRFLFCQNKKLPYSSAERNLLEKLSNVNGVDFSLLDDVLHEFSGEMTESTDKIIRTWAVGGFDFIHVASHLEVPDEEVEGLLGSKIRLTLSDNEVNLSLIYLLSRYKVEEFRFTRSPLVFLNACKTMTNPAHLSHGQSFPRTFMRFGAGAVVATACDVPDVFANEFAVKYYEFLFQSQSGWWDSLGEALRKTREYFLTECNNPLGLAYGLYTQYDF
jgi:hypothetical protein